MEPNNFVLFFRWTWRHGQALDNCKKLFLEIVQGQIMMLAILHERFLDKNDTQPSKHCIEVSLKFT